MTSRVVAPLRAVLRWPWWLGLVALVFLWAYWPTLRYLPHQWMVMPEYSHGFLVPGFAAILLWRRYPLLAQGTPRANFWGALLLLAGTGVRLAGTFFYYEWFDTVSLLPCLAGLCLLVGGGTVLRWAWPAIAFLFFMIPLPYQAQGALAHPLQHLATRASTYCLQTLGVPALSEGNVILLGPRADIHVGVVEACSGLSMLVVFIALALAVALISERPGWQQAILVLSAIPIAVVSNVARITLTGVLDAIAGGRVADAVFHDLAGWLMMPFALLLLALELWFLASLFVRRRPAALLPLS